MKITRLRLLGFKSFVDPTELLIEPGLTGVVGPNGCGKSNLLEALRWAMGETSYKTMRGAAMEDVIFAGSHGRPSRNSAEVTLSIDNSARTAPAEFNSHETLEVTRRIERDAGSVYRVNGKDARARDIRLLFEDAATGARSPALVGQGRIGEIVNSQPQERRRVLEDAAGIAGLHSRRHEAELRLKATEANLERLADLIGQVGSQLQSLRRQARQAQRYREIAEKIAEHEALHQHLLWTAACAAVEQEEAAFHAALTAVGDETRTESEALRSQSEAAEKLQPLRDEEATRAAVLQRLSVEQDALEREEQRAKARQAELETHLAQAGRDLAREEEEIAEAEGRLQSLAEEDRQLAEASAQVEDDPQLQAAVEAGAERLAAAETALRGATDALAQARAERRRLEEATAAAEGRLAKLRTQAEETAAALATAEAESGVEETLSALNSELESATAALAETDELLRAAETAEESAREAERESRAQAETAKLHQQELETERATLVKLLKPAEQARWTPLVAEVQVSAGYEEALVAALGDELEAASEDEAPAHWRRLPDLAGAPALPDGAAALADFVTGAAVLRRRLSQIGVVDPQDGGRLQADLAPGQRLVSKAGDLWRWDGYTVKAGAATAQAARLVERRRLDSLEAQVPDAEAKALAAREALQAAQEKSAEAAAKTKTLRQTAKDRQQAILHVRDKIAAAEHEIQKKSKALGALAEAQSRTKQALEEAEGDAKTAASALAAAVDPAALEGALEGAQGQATEARAAHARAQAEWNAHRDAIRLRQERREAIAKDIALWQRRIEKAKEQIGILQERGEESRADLSELAKLPAEIEQRRQRLTNSVVQAERERAQASDALAEAESTLKAFEHDLREVQGRLGQAREAKVRSETRLEAARTKRSEIAGQIREQFDCPPEACLARAGLDEGASLPEQGAVEARLHKLKADRERIGPVNLRAEEEEAELDAQMQEMEREKADVEAAIASLRQGIGNLNREGRKRLLEAFDTVNAHFKRLFTVLFGGGSAELQLVESDDPLQSGLQILACPPGKRPQVITLLSGGEKALTALALIFAVFLTNPSPICVLDEVDAPLDDANVERFCTLLREMAETTDTRFLVISHHPLTMANMSRLFGVTMAERGVSQLVSVDLETAEQLRDAS